MSSAPQATTYRFGLFELDPRNGELRRNGTRLKLQDQPLHVLLKLLERSGQIVTREELQSALWSSDTFVDFETGLNTAIKRLREVLGDSADVPVFIETVPRRGYRFIAPVATPQELSPVASPESEQTNKHRGRWLLVAGGSLAVLAVLLVLERSPQPPPKVTRFAPLTSDGFSKANLSTDGTRIYFNEMVSDHYVVSEVSASGGETKTLDSSVPGFDLGGVSQDGSKLLLNKIKEISPLAIAVMDLPSGTLRKLGDFEGDNARWTPDGRIIFSRGAEVFVANPDGSRKQKLFSVTNGFPSSFQFSPDGKRLRFTLSPDAAAGPSIWEATAEGAGVHELLPPPNSLPQQCCGKWTPDGSYFVFAGADTQAPQVWVREERHPWWRKGRKEPVQLTSGPMQFEDPIPSRDGKKIFALGSQPRAELVQYDTKSGAFIPFLTGLSAGDVETSHDHRSLVYVKYPEGTLWRSNVDGSNRAQLTEWPLYVALPHWSPDDKYIVFSANAEESPPNIYLVPAEGGAPEKLTSGSLADLDPSWSPDGKTLAFGRIVRVEANGEVYSIKLFDLKSRELSDLPAGNGMCCPRWSPDGRFLVGLNMMGTRLQLFSFSSTKWSLLAENLGSMGYMTWTPDSKYVFFDTEFAKEPYFYKVRVADSHLEPVVSLKDVRRYWGRWGPWTGLAPDGSPLLVRDISNQEIYALDLQLP